MDPEEPEINLGPEKGFLIGTRTGPTGQICKVLQTGQKEFWAQGILNAADRARITRCTSLGINVIHEAQSVIYFTSVEK